MAIDDLASVPFTEAIEHFRQKVRLPTRAWTDVMEGQHARAFVVAGATRDELLAGFQAAILKVKEQGTGFKDFQENGFDRLVAQHGWSYKGGRGWRSRVIYHTNMNTAYQAGRYRQLTDPQLQKTKPYWLYRHADYVQHPRPEHQAWDGLVLPADDPWWDTHYPPNGWGCQCRVYAVGERDLKRMGKSGPDQAPPVNARQVTVGSRGPSPRTVTVPEGVDPGWGYNVGQAVWGRAPHRRILQEAEGKWESLPGFKPADYGRPAAIPLDTPKAGLGPQARSPADVHRLLEEAIGAEQAAFVDPRGERVLVGQAIADHIIEAGKRHDGREQFFPLIRDVIEEPFEVWATFARNSESGRVAIRRRYVKYVDLGKGRVLGLVMEAVEGYWVGLTFFRGGKSALKNLREGVLVWGRE